MNSTKTDPTTAPKHADRKLPASAVSAKPETCCATTSKAQACASTDGMADAPLKAKNCANTHDGQLVSIKGNKLVMSNNESKEYTHTVATDAKVCCDGAACKADDLKVGSKIRLTTKTDDKHVAIKIESLNKKTEFAHSA